MERKKETWADGSAGKGALILGATHKVVQEEKYSLKLSSDIYVCLGRPTCTPEHIYTRGKEIFKKKKLKLIVVVDAFSSNTQETESGFYRFEANLVYMENSRTSSAT